MTQPDLFAAVDLTERIALHYERSAARLQRRNPCLATLKREIAGKVREGKRNAFVRRVERICAHA